MKSIENIAKVATRPCVQLFVKWLQNSTSALGKKMLNCKFRVCFRLSVAPVAVLHLEQYAFQVGHSSGAGAGRCVCVCVCGPPPPGGGGALKDVLPI